MQSHTITSQHDIPFSKTDIAFLRRSSANCVAILWRLCPIIWTNDRVCLVFDRKNTQMRAFLCSEEGNAANEMCEAHLVGNLRVRIFFLLKLTRSVCILWERVVLTITSHTYSWRANRNTYICRRLYFCFIFRNSLVFGIVTLQGWGKCGGISALSRYVYLRHERLWNLELSLRLRADLQEFYPEANKKSGNNLQTKQLCQTKHSNFRK